jgi:LmbE family N-acetylglucosaminyl deacetylase
MKNDTVLLIAPHLDDEVLGCGGTLAAHAREGHDVFVCFIAHRVYDHVYDESRMEVELEHANKAREILGYRDFFFLDLPDERLDRCLQDIIVPLERVFSEVEPRIVYSPFPFDNNQDHRAAARAAEVVLRPAAAKTMRRWLVYETPSSTEQAPAVLAPPFRPNVYRDITAHLDTKLCALSCYETESREYPHPRSPEAVRALAMKRGVEADLPLAEAFMLVREKD